MKNELVVVVGATGKQGQSTIKALLNKGYHIRALVRNPTKAKHLLHESSVEIFEGDLRRKETLKNLCNNAYGLFFVLPFSKESVSFGKRILDVAKESNLEHIIYSSVGGADRYSKVDHFRYKKEIETYLQTLGKPYTILRPAGYMDEFAHPKSIKVITGLLKLYLPQSKKFQLISLQDIGKFAEISFSNPDKYRGKAIEIAGDELTLHEVFEKIEKVKHIKLSPLKIPGVIKLILPRTMKQMFTFYAEDGWNADLAPLREEHPELLSFEDWLNTTDIYKS
jgi:uncharacterized protein YbjT (DUF2867 family)